MKNTKEMDMLTVFRMLPTYEWLMNVYVASWIFTGASLFVVYMRHMHKVEKQGIHS